MKKTLALIIISMIIGQINAQVFRTAILPTKGTISLGIEPAIHLSFNETMNNGENNYYTYLHGRFGLIKSIAVGLHFGYNPKYENYLAGELEFAVGKNFSLSAGIHSFVYSGFDITALYTFAATKPSLFKMA